MTKPVLEIRSLFKRFDEAGWVVEDASLTVEPGELLYVLGPSGSGKTTLLRLICGFETPDGGEILQNGSVISRPGWALPPERRRIGMVFQDYAIFPHLTVRNNVAFGLKHPFYQRALNWISGLGRLGGLGRADPAGAGGGQGYGGGHGMGNGQSNGPSALTGEEVERRLAEMFALTGLEGMERRYPHELSGGQQQRVALARALALHPHLVLLDEPFSNLDANLRMRIREEVRTVLERSGATSILVTHDREEAVNLAGRIAVMNEGRVEQVGTADELLHAPGSRFVANFIGMSGFIRGEVKGKQVLTELGNYPLPKDAVVPTSNEVDVLLRPDHMQMAGNGKGTPARVVKTDYVGVQSLYTLALTSGTEIQALFPGHPHLAPGDETAIRFDPPKLVLFRVE